MAHSIADPAASPRPARRQTASAKPKKPYPGYLLFAHATGQWAKKIRGRLHYFGTWADPVAAEAKYNEQKDDLHAGRTPRKPGGAVQVRDALNSFLNAKRLKRDAGRITHRTWAEYYATCERIGQVFGVDRPIDDLRAEDFNDFVATIGKVWGPVRVGNEIQRVRVIFKHAFDSRIIDQPVRFGPEFKRPSKKELRIERGKRGARMFEAAELRKIIKVAEQPMKAMVLLGINCGLGNTDVAALEHRHLDLKTGWLNFPRPKTGVDRRCPLWPETVAALREWAKQCPKVKDSKFANRVFITRLGHPWDKASYGKTDDGEEIKNPNFVISNPVALQFGKLLDVCKLRQPGRGFYALRHTTETAGGECRDQVAVDHIMGHARDDMASTYRERISDERLRAVTDTIWTWLKSTKAAR